MFAPRNKPSKELLLKRINFIKNKQNQLKTRPKTTDRSFQIKKNMHKSQFSLFCQENNQNGNTERNATERLGVGLMNKQKFIDQCVKMSTKGMDRRTHFITQIINTNRNSQSTIRKRHRQKFLGYQKRKKREQKQQKARNIFFGDSTSYSQDTHKTTSKMVNKMGESMLYFFGNAQKIRFLSEQGHDSILLTQNPKQITY